MSSTRLERIRVQTARMLEIYSLIRGELEKGRESLLPAREREELNRAIDTIAVNMQQLQTYFTAEMEESSPAAVSCQSGDAKRHRRQSLQEKATELDQLVDAVLKWHVGEEKGK